MSVSVGWYGFIKEVDLMTTHTALVFTTQQTDARSRTIEVRSVVLAYQPLCSASAALATGGTVVKYSLHIRGLAGLNPDEVW